MKTALIIFILIPLTGFITNLFISPKNEKLISLTALFTIGSQLLFAVGFIFYWMIHHTPVINVNELTLYKHADYTFFIDLFFDKITATYLFVSSLLSLLIVIYAKTYLHRESGYKRFFNTILFFFLGLNIIIFSGNFETLFIGWEIFGISSFLLIAFYRNRYLPVRNAFKIFSIYRIADLGLLLTMWLSHHLWHENITFLELNNSTLVQEHLLTHPYIGYAISLAILVAVATKSAQFPFSYWLPRAMEGPTPSSAIFYGSLAIHIGVFLILRTYPFWSQQLVIKILVITMGVFSATIGTLTSRVQSSIKSQIAYSSIAQIGLIFIEIALGLETLALIHFTGNAFLRAYQLLISPSTVAYLLKEQFFDFEPHQRRTEKSWKKIIKYSLYVINLKEWNLDFFLYTYLWRPFKRVGNSLQFLNFKNTLVFSLVVFGAGLTILFNRDSVPDYIPLYLPGVLSFIGITLVVKAFAERKNVFLSLFLIISNHFWIALAVAFNEDFIFSQALLYLSGVIVSGIVGFICLYQLKQKGEFFDLNDYYGHSYEHNRLSFVFLLACLGLAGFPITTTFLGEDLIFSHIHTNQIALPYFVSLSFIIDGLALIRIYSRIFLGPHHKDYHEIPYRSA